MGLVQQLSALFLLTSQSLLQGAYCDVVCGQHPQRGPWCFADPEKSRLWGNDVEKCYTVSMSNNQVKFTDARETCSLCNSEDAFTFDSHLIKQWNYPAGLPRSLFSKLEVGRSYWTGWNCTILKRKESYLHWKLHSDCNTFKRYICSYRKLPETMTHPLDVPTQATPAEFLNFRDSTALGENESTTSRLTAGMETPITSSETEVKTTGLNVEATPAVVGATLTVLLVLIVAVVILVILRRWRRHAHQRSSRQDTSTFANTTHGIDATATSKSQRPPAVPPQKTEPSAPEYAQIREMAPTTSVNKEGDADDHHHFVDNELYAGRVESHPRGGNASITSTRERDELGGDADADRSLKLIDNVFYGK